MKPRSNGRENESRGRTKNQGRTALGNHRRVVRVLNTKAWTHQEHQFFQKRLEVLLMFSPKVNHIAINRRAELERTIHIEKQQPPKPGIKI